MVALLLKRNSVPLSETAASANRRWNAVASGQAQLHIQPVCCRSTEVTQPAGELQAKLARWCD